MHHMKQKSNEYVWVFVFMNVCMYEYMTYVQSVYTCIYVYACTYIYTYAFRMCLSQKQVP